MITPTQDQALQRWDTLPDNLREALCFDANSEFIQKTCGDEHIPEEKISKVSMVSGYVLMGFLHPEDVAQELKERIGLDTQTANSLEAALNKRIFATLRTDIDKVYSPMGKFEATGVAASPKIIQDVSVAPPKPAQTLPAVGWSQMKPPTPTTPAPTRPVTAPIPPVRAPATPPISAPAPVTPAEPAPMILHEDTTFKAAQKNVDFTLSRPGGGAQVSMGSGSAVPTPPRPAVLEFGGTPAKPPAAQTSAVHYTDFKPPLAATPTANAGPRSVTQITPATPAPTAPAPVAVPKPPSPPQPPTPPASPQNSKPIVRDFL